MSWWLLPKRTKITYMRAVVSYCHDLTDPAALNEPLGVLLVAQTDGAYIASMVALREVDAGLDPVTAEMLSDLPDMLSRHVDRAFASAKDDLSPASVIHRLHDSLRTSLSVSSILPSEEASIPQDEVVNFLMKKTIETLAQAMGVSDALPMLSRPGKRPRHRGGASRKDRPLAHLPESRVWPLAAPC